MKSLHLEIGVWRTRASNYKAEVDRMLARGAAEHAIKRMRCEVIRTQHTLEILEKEYKRSQVEARLERLDHPLFKLCS